MNSLRRERAAVIERLLEIRAVNALWEMVASAITAAKLWFDVMYVRLKEKLSYPSTHLSLVERTNVSSTDGKLIQREAKAPTSIAPEPFTRLGTDTITQVVSTSSGNQPLRSVGNSVSRASKSVDMQRRRSAASEAPKPPGSKVAEMQARRIVHRRCSSNAIAQESNPNFDDKNSKTAYMLRKAIIRQELQSVICLLKTIPPNDLPSLLLDYPDSNGNNSIHLALGGSTKPARLPPRMPNKRNDASGLSLPSKLSLLGSQYQSGELPKWSEGVSTSAFSQGGAAGDNQGSKGTEAHQVLQWLLKSVPQSDRERVARAVNKTSGFSPLHVASLKDDQIGAKLLLEAGADPNAESSMGSTPLHVAVGRGSVKMTDLLLQAGANPNAMTKMGSLALNTAIHQKSERLVDLLLQAGANPRLSPEGGLSGMGQALKCNAVEILNLMSKNVKERGHKRISSLVVDR